MLHRKRKEDDTLTKIKICGLSRPEDIMIVNEALPDYIGFVFARSRRQITDETARQLKDKLHASIPAAGVFVNEKPERIIRLCREGIIDIIQLHGDEEEGYLQILRDRLEHPIIKAVRVKDSRDIERAASFPCDYLLLDAYRENCYGGCGEAFDWNMIGKVNKPYFLAGGIDAGNVGDAISRAQPYAIDVSSGVETNGFKDADKVIDIIQKVRSFK